MAFLYPDSFLATADGRALHNGESLLAKTKKGLAKITGTHGKPATKDGRRAIDYHKAPSKLRTERDFLKGNWRALWQGCTIAFDPEERGASIYTRTSRIVIGPLFLRPQFTVTDIEKVILHEFLHIALDIEMRAAQHGMMEQVLIYNLGYDPPANPVSLE